MTTKDQIFWFVGVAGLVIGLLAMYIILKVI